MRPGPAVTLTILAALILLAATIQLVFGQW